MKNPFVLLPIILFFLLGLCFYQSSKLDAEIRDFGYKRNMECVDIEILGRSRSHTYRVTFLDENKKQKKYIITGIWSIHQIIEEKE